MNQYNKINKYIFLAFILLIGAFIFFSLSAFTTAFFAAIVFYVLSKQTVTWLTKQKRWSKSSAAILVIIVSFFIILLPASLMVSMLYKKALMISQNTNEIIEPLKHLDTQIRNQFHFTLLSEKNVDQIQSLLTNFLSSILSQGLSLLTSMILMYFFLYFMITNINRMEAAIILYLPFERKKIELFGHELKAQTFSNAVGVPVIAVAHGLLAYVVFLFTGVNESGFWAVLTGFASIIPIIGTGLIWIPIGIYQLANGETWHGVLVLAWGFVVIGSIDNIIRFLLAKKMANVHPLVTVLGVIMGLNYFGITGLIFGPLIISYFIILLKIYYVEYQNPLPIIKKVKPIKTGFKFPFIK